VLLRLQFCRYAARVVRVRIIYVHRGFGTVRAALAQLSRRSSRARQQHRLKSRLLDLYRLIRIRTEAIPLDGDSRAHVTGRYWNHRWGASCDQRTARSGAPTEPRAMCSRLSRKRHRPHRADISDDIARLSRADTSISNADPVKRGRAHLFKELKRDSGACDKPS